ncbi:GntR family transcriptional regulator [Microbacterium sp. M28]|uniref:GntR family transcriptional regulator n=1 Tax=Microbacterium sp. M28 TaxID=2962064 RepID=UPI0021F48168|nr:GntR family transcriptional regulator [Microbacterium sp. M28]UYO98003.1 GntR family transcriptional regulator [Microbacterium sp. M28]
MLIRIEANSSRPLFEQVAASVRADILTGVLAPGDRLPSAREVAEALDINLHTVLHAYQQLRDERLVDLRRGRGAVVAASAAPLVDLAKDIADLVARAGVLGVSAETLAAIVTSAVPRNDRVEELP